MNGDKLIVIDTETNDVSKPELIQLGYKLVILDDSREAGYQIIREIGTLVAVPETMSMNPYAFKVHQITKDMCLQFGIPTSAVAGTLLHDLAFADVAICHNVSFDKRVIRAFGYNYHAPLAKAIENKATYCTMQSTKGFCGLLDKRGRAKAPKLVELYAELFDGATYESRHDALGDVNATLKCYMALPEELKWVNPE